MVSGNSRPVSRPPSRGGDDPHALSAVVTRIEQIDSLLRDHVSRRFDAIDGQLRSIHELFSHARKEQYLVEEFAELVGRSAYTVRRWIGEGKINAVRLAGGGPKGRWLINRTEVDRLIAAAAGSGVPSAFLAAEASSVK